MRINRRWFMLSLVSAAAFGCPDRGFAEEGKALFWRIKTRDNRSGIVFGYGRIAASLAPDLVRDGERLVRHASHVVLDMNSFTFTSKNLSNLPPPPLLPRLSQAVAAELRIVLTGLGMTQQQVESAFGLLVVVSLTGEGQTKAVPSVGDVIVNRAIKLGRSITFLLAENEARQLILPVDTAALNDTVDEKMITSLLGLRRLVGPIGAHSDKLYLDRKSEELYRFSNTLVAYGVPDYFRDNRDLLFSRFSDALTTQQPFFLLPVGTLTGPDGILQVFRQQGAEVSIVA